MDRYINNRPIYLNDCHDMFNNPPLPPLWLLLDHKCSWTLISAKGIQVSNMQFYDCKPKFMLKIFFVRFCSGAHVINKF